MRYCISDLHGKYELFQKLLNVIHFSEQDTMYICGDIIDKGESSIRLAKYISSFPNMHCILGNHEYAFLQYYHSILQTSPNDFDAVLKKLQSYFPGEGCPLDWDLVDWFDGLPTYIEEDDFICVHAGIPVDTAGKLFPLSNVSAEQLVHDRRFKNPELVHTSPKCVFLVIRRRIVFAENRKSLLTAETERVPPGVFRTITRFIWIPARGAMACSDTFA